MRFQRSTETRSNLPFSLQKKKQVVFTINTEILFLLQVHWEAMVWTLKIQKRLIVDILKFVVGWSWTRLDLLVPSCLVSELQQYLVYKLHKKIPRSTN